MNESIITVRYVKALYDMAEENHLLDALQKDMHFLLAVLDESKDFVSFLESPVLKDSEKTDVLSHMFSRDLNKLTMQFIHLLVENKRELYLKPMCQYFLSYYKQKQGIKDALIITATPLSDKFRTEIFKYITKRFKCNIELNEKVDPDLIGGFILRIDDLQINASISAQLNKIKRELIHS